MKISDAQYERIAGYFPIQTDNRDFINAILYITENRCSRKVYPDGHGTLKNSGNKQSANQEAVGTPSFMWYPQMIKLSAMKPVVLQKSEAMNDSSTQEKP